MRGDRSDADDVRQIGGRREAKSSRRRIARVVLLAIAGVAVVVVGAACWVAWTLGTGLSQVKAGANGLATGMHNSDQAAITSSIAQIDEGTDVVQSAAWSFPMRIAAYVPYAGRSVRDLQQLSDAGQSLSEALNKIAPLIHGDLYRDKTINLVQLDEMIAGLPAASGDLDAALVSLGQVRGDGIGGDTIAEVRDQATSVSSAAAGAARLLSPRRSALLDALGANGERNYLVPVLNPAQLRASGGAPLSAAVIRLDHGKVSVPFNGYIKGEAYESHILIHYKSASPLPWGEGSTVGLGFVNSNAHPDWRMAGDDLMRAWNKSQPIQVSGVFGIDSRGIESLLTVTGPISTQGYQTLDASNFSDLVLRDAYDQFKQDADPRHDINDNVGQQVIEKLVSGNTKSITGAFQALAGTASGRHFQMFFDNADLESAAVETGMSGEINVDPHWDTVAFYSRNRNMAKVDYYTKRKLDAKIDLSADGGAHVTQNLTVTNAAPDRSRDPGLGYRTSISTNEWFFVLPDGAHNYRLSAPNGYDKPSSFPDGLGRTVVSTLGTIEPGQTASLSLEYELPAGTFSTSEGLLYQTTLNPQPILNPAELNISVNYPDSGECEVHRRLDSTEQIPVKCAAE